MPAIPVRLVNAPCNRPARSPPRDDSSIPAWTAWQSPNSPSLESPTRSTQRWERIHTAEIPRHPPAARCATCEPRHNAAPGAAPDRPAPALRTHRPPPRRYRPAFAPAIAIVGIQDKDRGQGHMRQLAEKPNRRQRRHARMRTQEPQGTQRAGTAPGEGCTTLLRQGLRQDEPAIGKVQ
jgi:hypothetical protein